MPKLIHASHHTTLDDYAAVAQLARAVQELRDEAGRMVPQLGERTVWMVNSTAQGGGVAEMLPGMVALLRELGLDIRWLVIESDRSEFFHLTKRIHNLIHGQGEPNLGEDDRALYEAVSRENADRIREMVRPDDILVIHDPQPLATGAMLREELGMSAIWRCHIGLDEQLPATRAAWRFLEPFATVYDRAIFSAPEYIPSYLAGKATIIHPAVDPLSPKNRDLAIQKLVGILCDSGLMPRYEPGITTRFPAPARRLQADGSWAPATEPGDVGLLFRPIITQVSRWDRLKGFLPLLRGFQQLKQTIETADDSLEPRSRRALEHVRLVLAGPDPDSIQDDPEAADVLDELRSAYLELPEALQHDVALVALPMVSNLHNALMVNALQRCSSIVVQNSLREGFGLTATEAMWKRVAVVGSRACGLRQQIRDGLDGVLVSEAENAEEVASVLRRVLLDENLQDRLGRTAQHRVHHDFLIFTQLRRWLEVLTETAVYTHPALHA